jgi:4-oxalocrotonate tautomerase
MPMVIVKMIAGRSEEQKRELAKEITEVVCRVAKTAPEQVDVVIEEYERGNWAKAGVLFSDK